MTTLDTHTSAAPKRKLVLHIGAHKTGTTAIQLYLRHNQKALRERGCEILLPPTPHGRPANWNFMFRVDANSVFRLRPPELDKLCAQIDKSSLDQILSSEELFFLRKPAIRNLAKRIAGKFDQIHLVAYIRRQDQMAISHWHQAAQTKQSAVLFSNQAGPLIDLPAAAIDYLDYATRLQNWITSFAPDKVTCRIYDRNLLAEGDAVTDFLNVCELFPLTDRIHQSRANEALGTEAVFFLHELREGGMSQRDIRKIIAAKILPAGTQGGLPARAQAEAFMEQFAISNARLKTVIGAPVAFPDNFSSYSEAAQLPRFDTDTHAALIREVGALVGTVR